MHNINETPVITSGNLHLSRILLILLLLLSQLYMFLVFLYVVNAQYIFCSTDLDLWVSSFLLSCGSVCVAVADVCMCVSCADPAVREGDPDDGMDLQTFRHQDERGQVPSFCQGPSQELLRGHHVYGPAAAEAVWRLQVREQR